MKIDKYNPRKVSKTKKVFYTILLIFIAPYTLLLSLLFIEYVWTGRKPFSGKSGKLREMGYPENDKK